MSHLAFVRYCRLQELDESVYQGVPYPHPYLLIWLECKRIGNPMTGAPALPDPEVGWLDQDAELMLAFEVLEEVQARRTSEEERRTAMREQAGSYFGGE